MNIKSIKTAILSMLKIIKSVLNAFIGVQSRKNMSQDISSGKPIHYIFAGIIFTIMFVVSIKLIVNVVVGN